MAKSYSAKLHGNENGSIEFGACVYGVLREVRKSIANLADSRQVDEYAPGAIHALRKLCEGESCGSLARLELKEWEQTFFAWFDRVQKKLSPAVAKQFRAHAEEDFRILGKAAVDLPEYFWREQANERSILVTFESEEVLDAVRDAAEEKHPVDLGNALHKYLEQCAADLLDSSPDGDDEAMDDEEELPPRLAVIFMPTESGKYSLCVDDFGCFHTDEDREEGHSVTGYDVEDAVKKYLKKNAAATAKKVRFDSESSMFCARSKEVAALTQVTEILCQFAADQELFGQYAPQE